MNEDPQFLAFLNSEEARAYDGTLLDEAEAALKSYNGAEYGDEEEGRSQVVARDVAETADYMLTSVLDAFVASGRVVEFEPSDKKDEQAADDATEAMHFVYRRKNGYRVIHDWVKAGLLEKIGIVKSCVERKKQRVEREIPSVLLPGETEDELKESGIIEAEETAPQDDGQGNLMPMHKIVTLEEMAAEFRDYFVPLEEFRVSIDHGVDLDESVYVAHILPQRISQLTEMGFDVDELDLSQGSNPNLSSLATARDDGRSTWYGTLDRDGVNRQVWLKEEYVLYDLDGDGIAERLCVHRVGNTILTRDGQPAVEKVDYQPFEYWCPFPMQGRLVGQSLADKTMDIQRVNTVLERNMLDSLYFQTSPGTYVDEDGCGDHTIDDLLTVRPGRIVRFKSGLPPIPEQRSDVSAVAMQAIEFKIRQRESRTGITRLNKGVDDDVLNDTARGQQQLMSRGQQMERYIIRNFAEGVARLFMKKVGLMRRYGQPFQIRVDGEYRQVDPSQWPEDMEANVRVGLGSGQKDERIGYRNLIAQAHTLLKQGGSPLVTDDNIYNNMAGFCKDAGLQPNDLFTPPEKDEQGNPVQQQQAPDPEAMKAQAELQMQQQKHEADIQLKQADIQGKQQISQAQLQINQQKAEQEAALAQAKAEFERQQAVEQMIFERQLKQQQFEHEKELAFYKANQDAEAKKYRSGGKLDA